MTTYLRKSIALGAGGTIYPGSEQDYRYGLAGTTNRSLILAAPNPTRWVRLWADWPTLQPCYGYPPAVNPPTSAYGGNNEPLPNPYHPPSYYTQALDAQIAQARADGVGVILTAYRFPRWCNGGTRAQYAASEQAHGVNKDVRFAFPDDVTPESPWGQWIKFLAARYNRFNTVNPAAYAAVLEIVNEPNLQCWPQRQSAGLAIAHCTVSNMFHTAQEITALYSNEPLLAGPATADPTARGDEWSKTGYGFFTLDLINMLNATAFNGRDKFIWTQHNYNDVTFDHGPNSTAPDADTNDFEKRNTNRANDVRRFLVGRWTGWPYADATRPFIWLTEGGVQREKLTRAPWNLGSTAAVNAKQQELLSRAWDRMSSASESPGISMFSNYLLYSATTFDSGLRNFDGTNRPAYDPEWKSFPSYS